MSYPLEYTFVQDYLRRLREKRQVQVDYILSSTLDQTTYAENIGYVRALTDAETILLDLRKQFFPEYT